MPEGGTGATAKVAGPYQMSVEAPQRKGFRLALGETVDFRKLCTKPNAPFTIDTAPEDTIPDSDVHPFLIAGSDDNPSCAAV